MKQLNNTKNITIEYYATCTMVKLEQKNNSYNRANTDISVLLQSLKNKTVKDRTIKYNGEYLILSSINYNDSSNLWELVFFKSRSATIPFIINSNGNSRQIMLKEDEMISEVLCAEYDSELKILAVQRNVYAIGSKGLEYFFTYFLHEDLYLDSIQTLNEEKRNFFTKCKVKKFKLHIKNIKSDKNNSNSITQYNKNTSICKVIDAALALNSAIIDIDFSMGNSSKILNVEDDDFEIFKDLMNNNNVKCLELGLAPDERSSMQITDFMDFRVRDQISIQFIKSQPIDINELLKKITEKFKNNLYLR